MTKLRVRAASQQDGSRQTPVRAFSLPIVAENSKPQCQICHKATLPNAGTVGDLLRPSLLEFIQKRSAGL